MKFENKIELFLYKILIMYMSFVKKQYQSIQFC